MVECALLRTLLVAVMAGTSGASGCAAPDEESHAQHVGAGAEPVIRPMLGAIGPSAPRPSVAPAATPPSLGDATPDPPTEAPDAPDPDPGITWLSRHIDDVMTQLDRLIDESFELQKALLRLKLHVRGPATHADPPPPPPAPEPPPGPPAQP